MRWFIMAFIAAVAFGLLLMPVSSQELGTQELKRITPEQCALFTTDEFKAANASINPMMISAHGLPLSKILNEMNKTRVDAGLWSLEADHILVGTWSKQGKIYVSFAMFKDGCLVPGSSQTKTVYEWLKIAEAAGVTFEDFRAEGEDA